MKQLLILLLLLVPVLTKAQTASFTALSDTVCQDSCITFINTSTGHIDSIRWYVSSDSLANPHSDTVTACFFTAGVDSMKLYVYDSGRVDSSSQIIRIKPMPHPMVTDTLQCGFKVPQIYLSYKWYYSSFSHFTGDTMYYIEGGCSPCHGTIVVVDSNGCLGSTNCGVRCGDGVINITDTVPTINLYPTPAQNELTFNSSYPITTLVISNIVGQVVYNNWYNAHTVQVDVSNLTAGLYSVRINGTEVRKFIKQ